MKNKLMIGMMLLLLPIAFATSIYQQDVDSFYVYEDFADGQPNTTYFYLDGDSVSFSGGEMICDDGGSDSPDIRDGIVLTNSNFLVTPYDEWTISYSGKAQDVTDNFAVVDITLTNNTNIYSTDYQMIRLSNNAYGSFSTTRRIIREHLNGANNELYDVDRTPSALDSDIYTNVTYIKTNNADGTYNIEMLINGISDLNATSNYRNLEFLDDFFVAFACADSSGSNHGHIYDWIEINVTRGSPYPLNYYDDYNTINTNIWDNAGANNRFSTDGDILSCNPDGSTLRMMKFKPDLDFVANNWTIEFDITAQDLHAVHYAWFFDETWSTAENYWGLFFNRDGATYPRPSLYIKGGTTQYGSYVNSTTGTFKYEKWNNPNGTITTKYYFNDALVSTIIGTQDMTVSTFPDNRFLHLGCNKNSDNDWQSDWVNITVYDGAHPSSPEFEFGDLCSNTTYINNFEVADDIANITYNASLFQSWGLSTDQSVAGSSYSLKTVNIDGDGITTQSFLNVIQDGMTQNIDQNIHIEAWVYGESVIPSSVPAICWNLDTRFLENGYDNWQAGLGGTPSFSGYCAGGLVNDNSNNRLYIYKAVKDTSFTYLVRSDIYATQLTDAWMKYTIDHDINGTITLRIEMPSKSFDETLVTSDNDYNLGYLGMYDFIHSDIVLSDDHTVHWDELSVTSGGSTCGLEFQNAVPNLLLSSPDGFTRANQNVTFSFTVQDIDDSIVSCYAYVDDVLDISNLSVNVGEETYFVPSLSVGENIVKINCTDGEDVSNTVSRDVFIDVDAPLISSISPSPANTTVYTDYEMNIAGNVTDDSVLRTRVTIYYPNSTIFYQNDSGNLTANTSSWDWMWSFDTTGEPNGVWSIFIESADSHTAKYFPPALAVAKDQTNRQLSFGFADNTIDVALVGGNVLGQFESIDTTKETDRYTFELNFKNTITPNSRMVFRVTSESQIVYMEGSPYPAHMVTGDYWVDFAGVEGDITVTKVDDYNYEVEIFTSNPQDKFVFHSLGGLNEDNLSIEFEVNNCVPDWYCSGYNACNESDLASCNAVTDNNACGLPYAGDYTEQTPQSCDYCAYDLFYLVETSCDAQSDTKVVSYLDQNFEACCNFTGLPSDCYFGNESSGEEVVSCDFFAYNEEDIAPATINTIVLFLIGIGSLVTVGVVVVGAVYGFKMFGGLK